MRFPCISLNHPSIFLTSLPATTFTERTPASPPQQLYTTITSSTRKMDALLTRWTASNKDPQYLFPGNHAEILRLLQEWVTRRKQSRIELMAIQDQLHTYSSAILSSDPTTPRFSVAQKQEIASETLALFSKANVKPYSIPLIPIPLEIPSDEKNQPPQALQSTHQHETLLATYLLATLASLRLRQPNYDSRVRVDEAVCSYLAGVLPAFDRVKELSLLVDVAEEARREAKQVEIATGIRERTGVDVFVDTESRAEAVEKMLAEFMEKGHFGEERVE